MPQRTHIPSPHPATPAPTDPHRPALSDDPSDGGREVRAAADQPFWLTGLCPRWCTGLHAATDHPDDRAHWSTTRAVPLLLEPATRTADGDDVPQRLNVTVRQHCRETEPTILLGVGDTGPESALTLEEAHTLRRVLAESLTDAHQR